jgi:hypothetical protein
MINIYNATFIEIEACPRTLRTALVGISPYRNIQTGLQCFKLASMTLNLWQKAESGVYSHWFGTFQSPFPHRFTMNWHVALREHYSDTDRRNRELAFLLFSGNTTPVRIFPTIHSAFHRVGNNRLCSFNFVQSFQWHWIFTKHGSDSFLWLGTSRFFVISSIVTMIWQFFYSPGYSSTEFPTTIPLAVIMTEKKNITGNTITFLSTPGIT